MKLWYIMPESLREILEAPYRRDAHIAIEHIFRENEGKIFEILDAGAGDCFAKKFLKGRKDKYTAIDIEPRHDYVQKGDVQDITLGDNSFDLVLSLEVLECVSDPLKALKEMRRVLKNNGVMVMSTALLSAGYCEDRQRWSPPGLRSLVEAAGFKITSLKPMGGYYRMLGWQISKLSYKIKKPKDSFLLPFYYSIKIPIGLVFQILVPLLLFSLDFLDKEKRDTCGYVVVAHK